MRNRSICFALIFLLISFVELNADSIYAGKYSELTKILTELTIINSEICNLDVRLTDINQKISRKEIQEDPGWLDRRHLVKLTEEKAKLNTARIKYFEQLLETQNNAYRVSSDLLSIVTNVIDSTIERISSTTSSDERKTSLEFLMKTLEVRNWIIDTRPQYTQLDNNQILKKIDIRDCLISTNSNTQIRTDLINLLDDKIKELEIMIKTAREEEILQARLDQVNLELASISGDINKNNYIISDQMETVNKIEDSWGAIDYTGNGYSEDYSTWIANTQAVKISTLNRFDYLPVITSLETSELPNYIFTLDSLKNYYIAEKQKLLDH